MTPRNFLNFFRTRSGRLTLFGLLFTGALLILSALRKQGGDDAGMVTKPATNRADAPQVVQTVQREMEIFRPPPPKPEPPRPPAPVVTNAPVAASPAAVPPRPPEPPISLFADSAADIPESKKISGIYAPFGRLIPCETVITVDSASIQTPIIGLVTENIYRAGQLIIRAGTEVHGTAQTDRSRERIASGTSWRLVYQTGEELALKAIALDREFDNNTNQTGWGITDGSAGIRGRIIKSDDLAEIKLFAATFLSGAANALTEKEQTVFGTIETPSLNNAPFKGAQQVLAAYAQRIYESIQRDGFYVRVPSGKQFYLYVLQTIDAEDARVGGGVTSSESEGKPAQSEISEPPKNP